MQPKAQILVGPAGVRQRDAKTLEYVGRQAAWDGFIYLDDGQAEAAAVGQVLSAADDESRLTAFMSRLRGNFFLTWHDPARRCSYALVDNSGMYSAYLGRRQAASSFLDLCRQDRVSRADLSPEALVELLHLANVYFGRTLVGGIRKLADHELVRLDETGPHVLAKRISHIQDRSCYGDLFEATAPLASAVKGRQLSVDLTGGFDSRLLCCLLLHHGVKFEASQAGMYGHEDQKIAAEVAQALGAPFQFTEYTGAGLLDELPEMLWRLDGLGGQVGTVHRLAQLNAARHARGIDLTFKGQGGELYKEFFWTQDFPFYRSRKSRLGRLHRMRIEFETLSRQVLSDEYYAAFEASRPARLKRLERYVLPLNTQTYDSVYYHERIGTWGSRLITACQRPDLPSHSPLCELEMVKLGFAAPRRMRFYNRMHRHYITQASRAAARIKTTDKVSASALWSDMALDGLDYVRSKSKKLIKKFNQLAFNRTVFQTVSYDVELGTTAKMLASVVGVEALEALKNAGIVRPEATYDQIKPRFQSNFLVLGWFLNQLERGLPCADAFPLDD